ncbi:MAG: recombinase family protein [Parvibaculum sp.]|nr:recombinase family protein [Parvibaculum sp.]
MKQPLVKTRRCAIYTRVSTDHGLEQDFNSLDAQREAAEAFIKSQSHEGWRLIEAAYDDGGFSGGSMERPALLRLLDDIRSGLVDVVVVYKVDRLTRSLADFAKLVELFDAQGVSFVSVTQAFNTTSSMGRLTLNVLLSFAQFEREVTGERIRDKISASKKKGIWVGGVVPLGYRVEDKRLLIDEAEAETVRMIFERYLALGSMLPLLAELHDRGVRTRRRALATGQTIGGIPFTKGPLAHLLKNRTYIGEINHKGTSYPGEHQPIIDPALFEAVQAMLAKNLQVHRATRSASEALLLGLLVDDRGNTMTPSYSNKGGVRYRYYVSRALTEGRQKNAGSVARVSAPEIETLVSNALQSLEQVSSADQPSDAPLHIKQIVDRVIIAKGEITIRLTDEAAEAAGQQAIILPWSRKPTRIRREIIAPDRVDQRPIRSETRTTLVQAIAKGRLWLNELVSGELPDPDAIAKREGRSKRSVHMMLSLAFLAPDIVEAAVAGTLPRGIGVTRLTDLPSSWVMQREKLGLPARA